LFPPPPPFLFATPSSTSFPPISLLNTGRRRQQPPPPDLFGEVFYGASFCVLWFLCGATVAGRAPQAYKIDPPQRGPAGHPPSWGLAFIPHRTKPRFSGNGCFNSTQSPPPYVSFMRVWVGPLSSIILLHPPATPPLALKLPHLLFFWHTNPPSVKTPLGPM